MNHNIKMLQIKKNTHTSNKMKTITTPNMKSNKFTAQPINTLDQNLTNNNNTSFICPLFL